MKHEQSRSDLTQGPLERRRRASVPWRTFWATGFAAVLWLVLRSGTNPKRLAYPCQQAALATGSAWLGTLMSVLGFVGLTRWLRRRVRMSAVALLCLVGVLVLSQTGSGARSHAASLAVELDPPSWTSPTAVSTVYVAVGVAVPECSLAGGTLPATPPCNDPAYALRDAGVESLVAEMERRGDHFYRTVSRPAGIVGTDNVVVIKVNNQWGGEGTGGGLGRLTSSTDVLKGLIWAVLQHPEGFTGEVVVAENTQWVNPNWDTTPANAEDQAQSYQDVVDVFAGLGYRVSTSDWDALGHNLLRGGVVGGSHPPGEYVNGDNSDGYVLLEDPAGGGNDELSYPKFATAIGTRVSLRYGVWNGASYEPDRLTLLNLPVLKAHGMAGATIAWKNLVGFVTISDNGVRFGDWTTMHDFFWGYLGGAAASYGLVGRQLALVRAPDLNLVDAIWVGNQSNYTGSAVRSNLLLASTDPFAVDWYASEYVLRPIADPAWTWPQNTSAARGGTFRSATRVNQNAAAAAWPGGAYPWVDLLDGYDGDTPSPLEQSQLSVYRVSHNQIFSDGFESGDTSAWSRSSHSSP